jgi:uncharacterized protein (DUF302 family)
MRKTRLSLLFALAMPFALTMAACGGDDDPQTPDNTALTPFSLAAKIPNAKVEDIATKLANYIASEDDTKRGLPSDWLVAGHEEHGHEKPAIEATLKLPNGNRIVEVCNKHYAKQAMAFGGQRGVALPCEIAINQVGDDVEVVLLNPRAIFSTFWHDIPAEQAKSLGGMAAAVRDELDGVIKLALEQEAGITFPKTPLGPKWDDAALGQLTAMNKTVQKTITIPAASMVDEASKVAFKNAVVAELLSKLTHEEMKEVGSKVDGLSVKDWRSARAYALALPNNTSVVEVCSPTYANQALAAGLHHAPALPCEIAIYVKDDKVMIDILDPSVIFSGFFSDAPAEMQKAMGPMAATVRGDLEKVVAAAVAATTK